MPPVSILLASLASPSPCMARTPQTCGTIGGVRISASATTTVDSLEPPRIVPMKTPNVITCRPSRIAAWASSLAISWMPWPPMPSMTTARSMRGG